ncbi:MAG: hypothetical protein DRI71_11145 [Bacteroidetes bacterium]|nr:MAG: hypothetical protein DRI71_11145 [Bacteroidota bacterium]
MKDNSSLSQEVTPDFTLIKIQESDLVKGGGIGIEIKKHRESVFGPLPYAELQFTIHVNNA